MFIKKVLETSTKECPKMACEEKQKTHLDDVLGQFGMFDAYHLQLMVVIGLAYASNAAFSSNYIFAVEEVGYR